MQYRRLRAPSNHGQRLIDPPLSAVPELIAKNQPDPPLRGSQEGSSFLRSARRDLLEAAWRYTSAYRNLPSLTADEDASVVMTGHQPTLFHPGVWFKNFVFAHIAQKTQATAVNLLIDNDVSSQAAIRVPTGSVDAPQVRNIPFDQPQPGVPFEECRLLDPALFASFSGRVAETVRPFSPQPLVTELWRYAELSAKRSNRVQQCLAEARHCLEADWGLDTVELPLSDVCQQPAFRWFMSDILANAKRFRRDHNDALHAYRRVNRVRSKTHPVPELVRRDEWLEVPFWIWTTRDPQRRPLFARQNGKRFDLTDFHDVTWRDVPLQRGGNADLAITFFKDHEEQGFKIRPRALVTTMFARLILSDLFIHGIGGAKYDQLTDEVIRRFFDRRAPNFLVVTATAHLPIPREPVSYRDFRNLRQLAREFRFHPERHVEMTAATKPLIEEKQKWIEDDTHLPRQRHETINRLNLELAEFLREKQAQNEKLSVQVAGALARERILGSREYSFCLFSQATLQPLLLDI